MISWYLMQSACFCTLWFSGLLRHTSSMCSIALGTGLDGAVSEGCFIGKNIICLYNFMCLCSDVLLCTRERRLWRASSSCWSLLSLFFFLCLVFSLIKLFSLYFQRHFIHDICFLLPGLNLPVPLTPLLTEVKTFFWSRFYPKLLRSPISAFHSLFLCLLWVMITDIRWTGCTNLLSLCVCSWVAIYANYWLLRFPHRSWIQSRLLVA